MTSLLIKGPTLYAESDIIKACHLSIDGEYITSFTSCHHQYSQVIEFPSSYSIVPGRIDLHIHGVAGVDVMDATPESLITMSHMLAREGTTGFLATTMSVSTKQISTAIKNIQQCMENGFDDAARILGLHLEGPFIAASRMGAHEKEYLLEPDIALMRRWQALASGAIKLVTFAPELVHADQLIECLQELNIIASIGHSNATFYQAQHAINKGCNHVTHLFNAMSGLHHRHPGVVLAALQNSILCELIADGHHVTWEVLKFIMRIKGQHELCIVTDSMRAKCMPEGRYILGNQEVFVKDGAAQLADGTLAGSILTMEDAVKNLIKHNICTLQESIFLSSVNPAKQLGIFDKVGSIAINKWADLVVLDDEYRVVMTICRGKIIYTSS